MEGLSIASPIAKGGLIGQAFCLHYVVAHSWLAILASCGGP